MIGLSYCSSIPRNFSANALTNRVETTKGEGFGHQIQKIFAAMIAKKQETTIERTELFGFTILEVGKFGQ